MIIKQWLGQEKTRKGVVLSLLDPAVPELMGILGFDFVWIDGEHGAYSNSEIQNMIISAKAGGAVSLVRIVRNDAATVKPVLEMGANGIIFPMINTAEDARDAVSYCLYPPEGVRGYGPRRANAYGRQKDYLDRYQSQEWKIMQIEDIKGVENLDEILRVKGVDAILTGPFDLSASMGMIGQTGTDEIKEVFDKIAAKAIKAGIPFGAFAADRRSAMEWQARGAAFIAAATDTGLICAGAESFL